jgi:hypothetical protein
MIEVIFENDFTYRKNIRKDRTVINQLCPEGFPNSAGQYIDNDLISELVQKGRGS